MTDNPSDPPQDDEAAAAEEGSLAADTPAPDEPPADDQQLEEAPSDDELPGTDEGMVEVAEEADGEPEENGAARFAALAQQLASAVRATDTMVAHDTIKVTVDRAGWVDAVRAARDDVGLDFFSWLSATDWAREVAVGEPLEDPEGTEERIEVLCCLSTLTDERRAILATNLPKEDPSLDTLVGLFGGAEWHEREAHEMFGIDFRGHPRLIKLYLPDAFEGFPLRKSYPLLSREVKPWPGTVDVEDMPSTENPEAGSGADAEEGADGS